MSLQPHNRRRWRARAAVALLGAAALLAACGGEGGFPATPVADTSGNDVVLSGFEAGSATVIVADDTGTANAAAATVQRDSTHATQGSAALKVTLTAASAMIGLSADAGLASTWTGFRTLLVDLTSEQALDAGAVKLIAKAGSSYKWCVFTNTQAVTAGSATTLSFRLDWSANACGAGADDVAAVKYAYLLLPGGAGNVLYLDNLRLTKSVRVMALGDSITGNPGCWRQTLWADALVNRSGPPVDMVGVRNNAADCATALAGGWDADNAGFGGMTVRTIGSRIGLADAARTDTVAVSSGVTAVAGNLPVWLEKARPDVLLINLGTNDAWNAVAPASIVAGLDTLVNQARDSQPAVRVVVAQIPLFSPSGCETDCPARAAALNSAVAQWAQCKRSAQSPVTLADLTVGWNPATMTADGVHPNASGSTVMAGNWKAAVTAALDAIDSPGSGPDNGCVPTDASDRADASSDGGTFTITSFKTGVTVLSTLNNDGNPSASTQATLTLDSSGSHATDGSLAGRFTVQSLPSGGWVSAAQTGNGGRANWSAYRYLKYDIVTGDEAFAGALYFQSGADWSRWCQSDAVAVDAHSRATATLDLAGCASADLTAPQRFGLAAWNTGTFYIDHVRLEMDGTPAAASDLEDGHTSDSVFTITSFKTGTGAVTLLNNDGSAATTAQATLAHDTSGSHASEGQNAAAFTVINPPSGGAVAIGSSSNGGLADWTGYRTLAFDVITGDTAFSGVAVLQSGSGWSWCQGEAASVPAQSSGTVTLDLSTCSGGLQVPQRFQLFSWGTGTFYIDHIRLIR